VLKDRAGGRGVNETMEYRADVASGAQSDCFSVIHEKTISREQQQYSLTKEKTKSETAVETHSLKACAVLRCSV